MNILKDSQTPGDERRGMEGGGNHVNSYFCLFVHCYCHFTYFCLFVQLFIVFLPFQFWCFIPLQFALFK